MILNHDGSRGSEIALIQDGDLLMPALLAGRCIQRNQVIVRGLHVQIVVPHSHTTIPDVSSAFGLPEVMPPFVAIAGVHRPGIVRHGEIQSAVHFENRALDRPILDRNISWTFAADNQSWCFTAGASSVFASWGWVIRALTHLRRPSER